LLLEGRRGHKTSKPMKRKTKKKIALKYPMVIRRGGKKKGKCFETHA